MQVDENKARPKSLRELLYQQTKEQSEYCDVTVEVNSWVSETQIYISWANNTQSEILYQQTKEQSE